VPHEQCGERQNGMFNEQKFIPMGFSGMMIVETRRLHSNFEFFRFGSYRVDQMMRWDEKVDPRSRIALSYR